MTALLNPPLQASACLEMIESVSQRLAQVEHQLTHSVLDQPIYLQRISEAVCLRDTVAILTTIYQRNFAAS